MCLGHGSPYVSKAISSVQKSSRKKAKNRRKQSNIDVRGLNQSPRGVQMGALHGVLLARLTVTSPNKHKSFTSLNRPTEGFLRQDARPFPHKTTAFRLLYVSHVPYLYIGVVHRCLETLRRDLDGIKVSHFCDFCSLGCPKTGVPRIRRLNVVRLVVESRF